MNKDEAKICGEMGDLCRHLVVCRYTCVAAAGSQQLLRPGRRNAIDAPPPPRPSTSTSTSHFPRPRCNNTITTLAEPPMRLCVASRKHYTLGYATKCRRDLRSSLLQGGGHKKRITVLRNGRFHHLGRGGT